MATIEIKYSHFTANKPALDHYLNNPRGDVGKYLRKRGTLIVAFAKAQVGKKTGNLLRSIKMIHNRNSRGQYLQIGSNLSYALAHHEGTKPHIITPNDANILRFTAGGRVIYTHKVDHPGTRPNKFLSNQLWVVKI